MSEAGSLDEAVERARAGDRDAFADLYRALSSSVLSYVSSRVRRRDDAEDLVGQVFLEAMRDIERFDGESGAFRGWLFRIARDRAIDLSRRQDRRPEAPLEAAGDPAAETTAEGEALERIERSAIWQAVAALPEAQREVIVLRLGSGLSSSEIAEVLGKGLNAVKALQHRALAGLARALGDEGARTGPDPAWRIAGTGGLPAETAPGGPGGPLEESE